MITVNHLYKSFGSHEVLHDINEHIYPGEKVVIIGPSGSGKSTFLRCMNRLEEPTKGQIVFDGQDITAKGVNINKVRQQMGMVFQHFNLFPHLSIMENLTLAPLQHHTMKKVRPRRRPCACSAGWDWKTRRTAIQVRFLAARSSGLPSCARWP